MNLKERLCSYLQCIKKIDDSLIPIKETSKDGRCKIELKVHSKDCYFEIDRQYFDKINSLFKHKLFTKICDGILIDLENKILFFIELKANLKFDKFKKALIQLMSSYLKTISILNLLEDIDNFKILLLIVSQKTVFSGQDGDRFISRKYNMLSSTQNAKLYGYFMAFCKEGKLQLDKFPFWEPEFGNELPEFRINDKLIRKQVSIFFFKCEEKVNVTNLLLEVIE